MVAASEGTTGAAMLVVAPSVGSAHAGARRREEEDEDNAVDAAVARRGAGTVRAPFLALASAAAL